MGRKRRYRRKKSFEEKIFWIMGFFILANLYLRFNSEINNIFFLTFLGIVLGVAIIIGLKINSIVKLKKSGIRDIDYMSGLQFEHFLKYYFQDQGYNVTLTPGSGDYGADLVIEKDGQKIAVQAKRYRDPVNLKAVQEVVAAINHYRCSGGMVITNSVYQKSAWELAKSNNITLWDRKILINKLAEYHKQKNKAVAVGE